MANKQIYELTTRTFDGDCLVPFDTENTDPSTQAEKPYLSSKTSGDSLADFIANEEEYTNDLTTEDKTLTGAINELLVYALNIADEYDSTSTYAVDDFCIYEGVLYKCTTAIAVAEAWTPAHWTSTLIVDNFGAGGGASVTLGTTVPSDASGSDGDLYVQYDGTSYAVIDYYVKINGSWRKSPYSRVVALTQAEYDLITPDNQTLYIITDEQSSYQTKQDANLQTTADTIVGAINELNGINTYSTIEKVIGKWTDNKTIYRKVLTDNFGNSMSLNIDSGVEIDTLVYISIKVIKGNIVFELPFRNEISASEYYQGYSFVNLQTSGNNALITIIGSSSNSTYFNNCDIQIVIEYTKR